MDRTRVVNEHPDIVQGSNGLSELWISIQKELEHESREEEEEREGEKLVVNLLFL